MLTRKRVRRPARAGATAAVFAVMALTACDEHAPEKIVCANHSAGETTKIPEGRLLLGRGALYAEEARFGEVEIDAFMLDRTEVTNAQFADFVRETGYVTVAQKRPDPALHPDIEPAQLEPGSAVFVKAGGDRGWVWQFMPGAHWAEPGGPGSTLKDLAAHPVVHIAYDDAVAYARWKGGRLPTEDEWEYAARGGLTTAMYEWGDLPPDELERPRANTWQGIFPVMNLADDGFAGTAPVGCYDANGYGLFDVTGNVWEWVLSPDTGTNIGIIKGGSHLCAENFCRRFRPVARQPHELDFSTTHIGFRVAYDLDPGTEEDAAR